jgi:hypothetical protein
MTYTYIGDFPFYSPYTQPSTTAPYIYYQPYLPFEAQPQQGWQCPNCKVIYSPLTSSCLCSTKFKEK